MPGATRRSTREPEYCGVDRTFLRRSKRLTYLGMSVTKYMPEKQNNEKELESATAASSIPVKNTKEKEKEHNRMMFTQTVEQQWEAKFD